MALNLPNRYAEAHASPKGPGDARPTARQIIEDEDLVNGLIGKTILITGGNEGAGLQTARALHLTGARVIFTARSQEKGKGAINDIIKTNGREKGGIDYVQMQLDDLDSVREAAKTIISMTSTLNILVANAGACPDTNEITRTKQGFEFTFGINHLGHCLLFQHLKPLLLSSSTPQCHSRVIVVASIGHRLSPTIRFHDLNYSALHPSDHTTLIDRYAHFKLSNIYMSNHLNRLYSSQGLNSWSLQPGGMYSSLLRNVGIPSFAENPAKAPFAKTAEQGAATSVWAAVAKDLEGKGGRYLESLREVESWEGKPEETRGDWMVEGYAKHAYDQEAEERLWRVSEEMVRPWM